MQVSLLPPLSWATHSSFKPAQVTAVSDVEKGRTPVIHVSNIDQTNSEVSSCLPAPPVACSQLWESPRGVLIRGNASPGLWFAGTGERSSYAREQAKKGKGRQKKQKETRAQARVAGGQRRGVDLGDTWEITLQKVWSWEEEEKVQSGWEDSALF